MEQNQTNPAVLMSKTEREQIIMMFAQNNELPFAAIEKATGLRSNHLVYFLKQLQDEGLLEKHDTIYRVTLKGQSLIPNMVHLTGKESPPLAVVVAAIIKDGKICLLHRKKRPFQGYWGCIGGKLRQGETIIDAAVREAKEETGLDVAFEQYCGLCHEHVKENGVIKHSFLLFVCKMKVVSGELVSSNEGQVDWFDLNNLPTDKIVPSDLYMLEKMVPAKVPLHYSVMHDNDGKYLFDGKTY